MPEGYCKIKKPFPKAKPLPKTIRKYTRLEYVKNHERIIILRIKTAHDSSGDEYISEIAAYRIKKGEIADYTHYHILPELPAEKRCRPHYPVEKALSYFINFVWADDYYLTGDTKTEEINTPVIITKDPEKALLLIMDLFKRDGRYYSGNTGILLTPDGKKDWRAEYDLSRLTLINEKEIPEK